MITQIIFFVSIAVFIVILVRRGLRRGRIQQISPTPVISQAQVVTLGSFSRVLAVLKNANSRFFRRSKAITPPNVSGLNHSSEFWQSEESAARPELPSRYEDGERLFKEGKLTEAEKFFIAAATKNPSDAKIYAKLGLIYLQQKNFSDAIESLKIAAKLEKHNPSRHYNLALAYWSNGDLSRAIPAAREAVTLDPVTEKYRQLLEQLLNREKKG